MTDVFSKEKRSEIMSRIGGKNTKPEEVVRSLLHKMGYRFRLHASGLPGKPDIVLPRYQKAVFVNGCFWHGHKSCKRSALPESNRAFWAEKIAKNMERDKRFRKKLNKMGWSVLTIWACQIRDEEKVVRKLERFMAS